MRANEEYHEDERENVSIEETDSPKQPLSENGSAIADLFHVLGIKKKRVHRDCADATDNDETVPNHSSDDDCGTETTPNDGFEDNEPEVQLQEWQPPGVGEMLADEQNKDPIPMYPSVNVPPRKKLSRMAPVMLIFALAVVGTKVIPYLLEPKPPTADVVGSYNDKYITVEQLQAFVTLEQAKEREHMVCPVHGYDHSKCTPEEACEAHPVDSLEGYKEMVTRLAVEQMIQEWANTKGITQREDVQHGMEDLLNDVTVEQYMTQLHEKNITPESISSFEVQKYYDDNQAKYQGKTLSQAEDEIRQILAAQKDEDFFPQYIEELKKTAGLQVNFDVLKVSEPTEDAILAYYDKNIANFKTENSATYSEIVISGGDASNRATEAVRQLRSGKSFESVAESFSEGGKATERSITKKDDVQALSDAIWKMRVGEISDPIQNTNGSVSIVKLLNSTEDATKPLDSVRAEIKKLLLLQNMEAEYATRKSEMLFSVHSRRYTLGEFYTEFKELSEPYQAELSTFEAKKQLVEQIIAQELLLEKSTDQSADDREEHRMEEMKIQYLAQILHQDEVDEKLAEPTEEEIQKFYDENKNNLVTPATVQLNLIWISQGENAEKKEQALKKANDALAAINGGTPFAEVAKQYSEDPSAATGGQIEGELYKEYLIPTLADAAFSLEIGSTSQVLEYQGSYYILQVRDRKEEQTQSFEQASEAIKSHLSEQQHAKLESEMESTMLKNANFIVYDKTIRRVLKDTKA